MLYGQFYGARSLRDIEMSLQSHASKLHHLGGCRNIEVGSFDGQCIVSGEVFGGCFCADGAIAGGYRRKIGDCVRLIDSTSVRLSSLSGRLGDVFDGRMRRQSAHHLRSGCRPTALPHGPPANVNDITAAKEMPIEPGATYVFDLGYYDYGWWATLDEVGCRIVTRFKTNTPFEIDGDRPVAPEILDPERSDRTPSEAARSFPSQPDGRSGSRNPCEDRDWQNAAHLHQ